MKIYLTKEQKEALAFSHKGERDRRVADRIKAVLLYVEGWSQVQIAQALGIRPETVHDPLKDFASSEKLKPENGRSESHLTPGQTAMIVNIWRSTHLYEGEYYCVYGHASCGVRFTVSGMTKWLHCEGFSYKNAC